MAKSNAQKAHENKLSTLSGHRVNGKNWKNTSKRTQPMNHMTRSKATSLSWKKKQQQKIDLQQFKEAEREVNQINNQYKKECRLQQEEKKRLREENELKNQLAQAGGSGKSDQQNSRLAKRLKKASLRKAKKLQKKQAQML